MIGGMSGIENDVIPYGQASGKRANLVGLNLVGLKRRGAEREEIQALRQAFTQLFKGDGTFAERAKEVATEYKDSRIVGDVMAFLNAASDRAICLPE
jgi:UDP-N-acetylglucosamine acyltransferase